MKYLLSLLFLCACVSEQQVRGNLYQNDGLDAEFCAAHTEVQMKGIYRVVKCPDTTVHGCENGEPTYEEVLSYCSPRIIEFLSADRVYVEDWLKQATRPK